MIDPCTMDDCPTCGGSGTISRPCPYEQAPEMGCEYCGICKEEKCHACDGTGSVSRRDSEPDPDEYHDREMMREYEQTHSNP